MTEPGRDKLFRAALEVCAERGYQAARMGDIAQRAGMSKGGLYHHFKSKQELFLQLFHGMFEDMGQHLAHDFGQDMPAPQLLAHTFELFASMVADQALSRTMTEFYIAGMNDEAIRGSMIAIYDELLAFGRDVLERGIADGDFRKDLELDAAARALFMGGDGIVFLHIAMGRADEAPGALKAYAALLVRGLMP